MAYKRIRSAWEIVVLDSEWVEESLVWTSIKSGNFTFASTYELARSHKLSCLSFKSIWHPNIPPKMSILHGEPSLIVFQSNF